MSPVVHSVSPPINPHPPTHLRGVIQTGPKEQTKEIILPTTVNCISSADQCKLAKRSFHTMSTSVCQRVYVYIRVHEYAYVSCVCVSVLWLPLRGRQRFCRQVNPALRLSIKLSHQRINNSDSSLSRSITEHRLRGRQRHDKGTEVIYSLIQLAQIQIKMHTDSLRNCALVHFHRLPHTHNAKRQGNMRIHKFTHTQRATP